MSVLDRVSELLGDRVIDSHAYLGDATLLVTRESVHDVLRMLKETEGFEFNMLMDLTCVDYLGKDPRFEVVYHLASLDVAPRGAEPSRLRQRVRIKVGVPEAECHVASCVDLWPAANWMEREVFDLYGVRFDGHPDLRRILLYDQFEGHPLRKDYPKERRQPLVGPRN